MMLRIYCSVPEGESLFIKVNNEIKTLFHFDELVEFDIPKASQVILEVEQKASKNNVKFINIIFFMLTMLIQGIFNCIFINDNYKWYENITPWVFKAKVKLNVKDNLTVKLIYEKSTYTEGMFLSPKLTSSEGEIITMECIKNYTSFKNCWFNYVKRLFSLCSIVLLITGILMYVAISHSNSVAAVIVGLTIIGTLAITIGLSVSQHNKLNKLLSLLESAL